MGHQNSDDLVNQRDDEWSVWVCISSSYLFFFFFFQAEDGIRDLYVTGVQTCALPILGEGTAELDLYADGTHAFAAGTFRGHLVVACSRCINPVRLELDEKLRVTFKIGRASCRERVEDEGVGG